MSAEFGIRPNRTKRSTSNTKTHAERVAAIHKRINALDIDIGTRIALILLATLNLDHVEAKLDNLEK